MKVLVLDRPASKIFASKLGAWCDYKNELRAAKPDEARLAVLEERRFTLGPVSLCEARTTVGNRNVFRDFERHREFLDREGIPYATVGLDDIEGGVVWRA